MRKSASPRLKKQSAARIALNGSIGAALAYLVIPAFDASAVTYTWSGGGGDGNWTTGANWDNGVPSNTGSDFIFAGTTGTLTGSIGTITSVNSITYNSDAGAFTGNSSASNATLTLGGNVSDSSTNTQTLAAPISINGARTITVGTGGTLVFGSTSTAYVHNITSTAGTVTFTGAGELKYLTSTAGSLNFADSTTNLTMTGLGTFTVSTGTLRLGSTTTTTASTITLAATNSITATNFNVGAGSGNFTANATLRLGTTNVINADSINVGAKRSSGTIDMNGGSGTVTIRGTAGGSTKANMTLGLYNTSPGNYNPTGIVDFTGATQVNAKFGTVILGQFTTGGFTGTGGLVMRGNLTIDGSTSTVTADTIRVGYTTAGANVSGTGTRQEALGNLVVKNGQVTISGGSGLRLGESAASGAQTISNGNVSVTGGSLSVSGGFLLGSTTAGSGAASNARAVLSITGGTVTAGSDITTLNARSTITLNGGTLNMGGFAIGTSAQAIGSNGGALTFQSGELKNVASINGSGGVTKSATTSTLTLSGTNSWTGATAASSGTLVVNGSLSGTSGVAATGTAKISGTGAITAAAGGTFSAASGTTIAPNKGGMSFGVASGSGTATLSAGSTLELAITKATSGAQPISSDYSKLTIGAGVATTITGSSLSLTGLTGVQNLDLFTILDNNDANSAVTGTFSVTGAQVAATLFSGATYSFSDQNGQQWLINYGFDSAQFDGSYGDFSTITTGNDIALLAVPEPGAFVSLLGGFVTLLGFQRRRRQS